LGDDPGSPRPRLRSSRLAFSATLLMIVLGVLCILVNTTLAVVLIALGLIMFVFERSLSRRVSSAEGAAD
jgi:Flp pilus assembly protein TadB